MGDESGRTGKLRTHGFETHPFAQTLIPQPYQPARMRAGGFNQQSLMGNRVKIRAEMRGALDRQNALLGRLDPKMTEYRQVQALKAFSPNNDSDLGVLVFDA